MTWRDQAACRNVYELMFDEALVASAVALCAGCPVSVQCGAYAAEIEPTIGVWNGVDTTGQTRAQKQAMRLLYR